MSVLLRAAAVARGVLGGRHRVDAADYPAHPITLVVPYAAGGGNDVIARIVAERMSASLGQPIVIENRGGAGGTIATRQVAKAEPDGYTLLIATSSLAINPSLYPNVGYDPRKDFAPIGLIASSSNVVLVHPSVPARSIAELIALAKQQDRQAHLRFDRHRIERASRRRAVCRHGRHEAQPRALQRLRPRAERSARRPCRDDVRHHGERRRPGRDGSKVRALAVTGATRSALFPDLPTVAEAGLPGYEAVLHYGIVAPAGTPRPVVEKLNAALNAALASDEVKQRLAVEGAEPLPVEPR